ncbi:MAG: dihydrofolate reductase family protein [Myxococcota bacterium]
MRQLTYFVATSLDGFIAGPGGSIEAFPSQGDHLDALLADYPETLPAPFLDAMGVQPLNDHFDTVVMGWRTYDVGLSVGLASPYPHLRQFVCSRRCERPHDDVIVTDEDPRALVRRLKAEPGGGIWLCGGGALAGVLHDAIDRLFLKVNPVLLYDGVPLFGASRGPATAWRHVGSRRFDSGVVFLEYEKPRR